MRISHATSAGSLAVFCSTIALVGCGGVPLATGGRDDAGNASGVGIFATVNGDQQSFTTELAIPYNPVVLAAQNLVRKETLVIIVTDGETMHGAYACQGGSVRFEYTRQPNDGSPLSYIADGEHGACTLSYDWTGEFYEGSFTASLVASGPVAYAMTGTFRLK
jgi:hypothetical protein